MSDAAIYPASDAATRPGPVWEFGELDPSQLARLGSALPFPGFPSPVSPTVVPYLPSTDLALRQPLTMTRNIAIGATGKEAAILLEHIAEH